MKAQPNKPPRRNVQELKCPFCRADVPIVDSDLVDGGSVTCPHCKNDATLLHERIEHSLHEQWSLIEPEIDDEQR
jgi:predicted Zn finger-like uncharacterized protein